MESQTRNDRAAAKVSRLTLETFVAVALCLFVASLLWPSIGVEWTAPIVSGALVLVAAATNRIPRQVLWPSLAVACSLLLATATSPLHANPRPMFWCLATFLAASSLRRERSVALVLLHLCAVGVVVLLPMSMQSLEQSREERIWQYVSVEHWGGYPELGLLALLVLPVLASCALVGTSWRVAVPTFVMTVSAAAGLLLTYARASLLASLAGLGLLLAWSGWRRNLAVLAIAVLAAGLLWTRAPLFTRMSEELAGGRSSLMVTTRVEAWNVGYRLWRERPVLGWGPGAYSEAFVRVMGDRWDAARVHPHNSVLNVMVEGGAVLAFAVVWLGVVVLFRAAAGTRRTQGMERALRAGLLATLVAVALRMQLDYFSPATEPLRVMILVSIVAGLAVTERSGRPEVPTGAGDRAVA
jgi:O-antigen ligase